MFEAAKQKKGWVAGILKALGPGLIFAGTSIGVSHIVQSTRAGANYGFALIGIVVYNTSRKSDHWLR